MELFKIKLTDLRFFSSIGVFEQERKVGNDFIVNLEIRIDASSFEEENLDSSISYAEAYEVVKYIMGREWLLLETVAIKIKETLLARWPFILGGSIDITKVSPPISGINGQCGIEYLF
ncbi:MAG: dihydroneopterin aldolase [Muribaculaceae bacterium]|nr:dihydroneopterin aldolase [Muribaculaceae bacterium]